MPDTSVKRGGFILMAGEGKRLRGLFPDLPKPIVPVKGLPLAAHVLFDMHRLGVRRVIANLHVFPEKIRKRILEVVPGETEIVWSIEEHLLGTGGGILHALPLMNSMETVIIRTCDILTGSDLTGPLREHETGNSPVTLVVSGKGPEGEAGKVWIDQSGEVVFGSPDVAKETLRPVWFVGIHFVCPDVYRLALGAFSPPFSIIDVYRFLQKRGVRIRGVEIQEGWLDLGTEDGFRQLDRFLSAWPAGIHSVEER
ncbi:nucleotidyltransferase family protein [Leptospirillum sp. Group II 'CF-1']|nr:sugar phosphate nucleotidyltransferase [Leptospirillum sp. Group II 'CF-1']